MIQSISGRRSIRKYQNKDVPRSMIEEIIKAGMLAPSSKNRQPWEFVVVTDAAKADMLKAMQKGLEREKISPILPYSAKYINAAEYTLQIMEQAPVVILIVNPLGMAIDKPLSPEDRIYEICNAQSIGAAIENMTLTATALDLGSLWVCDTYFAYKELKDWLHTGGELFAALVIGYADEVPSARPRKEMNDVVTWRSKEEREEK